MQLEIKFAVPHNTQSYEHMCVTYATVQTHGFLICFDSVIKAKSSSVKDIIAKVCTICRSVLLSRVSLLKSSISPPPECSACQNPYHSI